MGSKLFFNPYVFSSSGTIYIRYPPAAMTAETTNISSTTITGQVYTAASGPNLLTGFGPSMVFDRVVATNSNLWTIANQSYNATTGAYDTGLAASVPGGVQTTAGVNGEWVQLQVPTAIVLKSYVLTGRATASSAQNPKSWTLFGSNNGSSWTQIDTQTGITSWNGQNFGVLVFSLTNTTSYTYFRIVLTSNQGTAGIAISEWALYTVVAAEYPPTALNSTAMTGQTISGQTYGNGTYTVKTGTQFSSSFAGWYAFDKSANTSGTSRWATNGGYNTTSGAYTGAITTTNAGAGDYLQITLPAAVTVTYYSITNFYNNGTSNIGNTPKTWYLVGTNDATPTDSGNWTVVDSETNIAWTPSTAYSTQTFATSSPGSYSTYRLVVNTEGNIVDANFTLQELKLFGY